MKIVFFGTSSNYAWLPLLELEREHEIAGIIESAPHGSKAMRLGFWAKVIELVYGLLNMPSLWHYASRKKLPYFYLTRNNSGDLGDFLRQILPDIGVVASFNQLLPEDVIHFPQQGVINIHPSLLPAYRGPCVWFWSYHQMEKTGGVTIHYLDQGEDTGDILLQESFPIPIGILPDALEKVCISIGTRLLLEALQAISSGNVDRKVQVHLPSALRARRLKQGEDLFNWQSWTIEHTFHFLRGVYPWYGALNRRHGLWGSLLWRASHYEKCVGSTQIGKISLDTHGFYFSHPGGRVRLRMARQSMQTLFSLLLLVTVLTWIILG